MADLFYYESGYIDDSYFVYTADAEATPSSSFSATCDATKLTQAVEVNASLFSAAEQTATVNTIASGVSTLACEFTQTAYGARDRDIDLFALSDAALAVQVDRLRDNNVSVSDVFSVAIDYTRIQQSDADADTLFTAVINGLRSRATSMETQAAFSLSASVDGTTDEVTANISSSFSVNANIGKLKTGSAQVRSYFGVLVSRNAGPNAPQIITGTFDSNYLINSANRTSNLQSLLTSDNWFFETFVFISPQNGLTQQMDTQGIFYIPLGTRNGITSYISATLRYRAAQGYTLTVTFALGGNTTLIGTYNDGNPGGTFANLKVAVSFTGGQKAAIYVGNTRRATANFSTAGWTMPKNQTVQFAPGFPYTFNSVTHNAYTDFSWLTLGNFTNSGDTSYTSQIYRTYSTDTIFLYEFNGNGVENTALTQTGNATVASNASIFARLSGISDSSSTLTSTSVVSATISHIHGADLTAFSDAALTTTATKIKSLESDQFSEFAQSTTGRAVRDGVNALTAETTISLTGLRIQPLSAAFESVASQLTATVRLAGLFADDITQAFLSVDPVVVRSADSNNAIAANLTADNYRVRYSDASFNAETSISIDADVRIDGVVSASASASMEVSASRFRGITENLGNTTSLTAIANNLGKIESIVFNAVTMTVDAVKIVDINKSLDSESSLSTITSDSLFKGYSSAISANATLASSVRKTMYGLVNATAFATELVAVVKNVKAGINASIVSTMSITANKTVKPSATLTSTATTNVTARKTARITKALSSTSTVYAAGTSSIDTTAYLVVQGFEVIAAVKTGNYLANLNTTSTLAAAISVRKQSGSSMSASFAETAGASRILKTQSALAVASSLSANAGKLAVGEIHIASAMSFTAGVREIFINEIVYVIPAEVWEYEIGSETREYTIGSETREYIIK